MIKSMTAFGRAKHEGEDKDICVEVRSVNSRYFDANVRSPRSYMPLEEKIKAQVQKSLSRAKADIFVTVSEHTAASSRLLLDRALAKDYIEALRTLQSEFSLKDDISTVSVAQMRELFTYESVEVDLDAEWQRLAAVIDEAMANHTAMREAEGERTCRDIVDKMKIFEGFCEEVARISESEIVGYRAKFETRLRALLDEQSVVIDENRILTECAIYADKVAIDEELARLRSHRESFYRILEESEPVGRKLDFLMQEFNRETNTIGSKANNASIAAIVVKMKNELEKIREQVQNIE